MASKAQLIADTIAKIVEGKIDIVNAVKLRQVQVANHPGKQYKIELSTSGVHNVWLRENMQTIGLRLQK